MDKRKEAALARRLQAEADEAAWQRMMDLRIVTESAAIRAEWSESMRKQRANGRCWRDYEIPQVTLCMMPFGVGHNKAE